ncbi:MAG: choice-of-anchor D domain-containing protein [Candidatus Sumerlaeaceae bacterium]
MKLNLTVVFAAIIVTAVLPGFTAATISVTTAPLTFGFRSSSAGPTTVKTLIISNVGDADLVFSTPGIQISGASASSFQITNSPATTPLPSGQSRSIDIVFDPTGVGRAIARLEINTNSSSRPAFRAVMHGFGGHFFGGNSANEDPVLWLSANDALVTDTVPTAVFSPTLLSVWPDISGNGNHAISPGSNNRPHWRAKSSIDVSLGVYFHEGSNTFEPSWTLNGSLSCGAARSIAVVADPGEGNLNQFLIRNENDFLLRCPYSQFTMQRNYSTRMGNGTDWYTTRTYTQVDLMPYYEKNILLSSLHDGSTHYPYVLGRALPTEAGATASFNDGYILGEKAEAFLVEVLVFNRMLSTEHRLAVDSYLSRKNKTALQTSSSVSIASGDTGLYTLGDQGVVVNLVQNTGTAGSLNCIRVNGTPTGSFSGASATGPNGSSITPSQFSIPAVWQVSASGLSTISYAITIDMEEFGLAGDLDRLVVLKRSNSSSPWVALNTSRAATALCSSGQTSFSEFTVGQAPGSAAVGDWELLH